MIFKLFQKLHFKFFSLIGAKNVARIPANFYYLNFLFQRFFRVNGAVPFQVHFTSRVQGAENMILGEDAVYCMAVSACANIVVANNTTLEIGEKTIFARNVCIRTANHDLIDRNKYTLASVRIGKNCWLGHGVAIMPGVQLGDNITVGANAVVTKSFESNCIIAGVPAKLIKAVEIDQDTSTTSEQL